MAASFPTANSLAELRLAAGALACLDASLQSVLPTLTMPVSGAFLLQQLGPEAEMSVRQFLGRKDLHRKLGEFVEYRHLLQGFKKWLELQPTVEAPAPADDLKQAYLDLGIPDVLQWPLGLLVGATNVTGGPYAVGRLFDEGGTRPDGWRGVLEHQRPRIRERFTKLRAGLRNARPLVETLPLPEEGPLRTLLTALAEVRQARLFEIPLRFPTAGVQVRHEKEDLVVTCLMEHTLTSTQVRLPRLHRWHEQPRLVCSCGHERCLHQAAVLDVLLADSALPRSSVRENLEQGLRAPWQRALADLDALSDDTLHAAPEPLSLSFVFDDLGYLEIRAHRQGKRGPSKQGRTLMRVAPVISQLSGPDRRLGELFSIAEAQSGSVARQSPFYGDAVLHLVGHPAVFFHGDPTPRPVVVVPARVEVLEEGGELRFRFHAGPRVMEELPALAFKCSQGALVVVPHETTLLLVKVSPDVQGLMRSLGRHGAVFPKEALPSLASVLPRFEAVATLDLPDELKGEERSAQARAVVRVEAGPSGLLVLVRTEPLTGGPLFLPGQGVPVSAFFDGTRRAFARRDFTRELAEATAVQGQVGLDAADTVDPWTWHLAPGDAQVETLRRLVEASTAGVHVEWKAPRPTFTREANLNGLRLSVQKKRDWFGLHGEVEIDDRRVALASLLEAARARRRWVKVGENEFAQLSEALVEHLQPLAHLPATQGTPTLSPGAAPVLEALMGQVAAFDAVAEWKKLAERLAAARTMEVPAPKGLKAELRDYQVEGYRWMSRLAAWGAGGVLADDMGLGKTLQALAVLHARGKLGPALVVAPSSVLHTWQAEAARFAPKLKLAFFHESGRSLDGLGAYDVVVVSWSLFARQADLFAEATFATVVFDEAHAIKNASTLRAKAAHRVKAEFTLALSGTPIENHVGELWSLFRAVMPALLGSQEAFVERFGSSSPDAVKALATLVRPFILRRTKAQVAKELPARTEVNVVVPLSPEERALYDDVRLVLAKELGELGAEDARFEVLQALTRLRLTACHPRLVDAEWTGPTSKLTRVLELLRDLVAGGHRALVFSQFVKHLELVAQALRAEGLTYSYLDGQVPIAERQRRVEAFQAGKGGEVFLISLRAGGTGLTLTAADYVVHLDPWWNPAVEDQASDRAHRLGQDRPVTIYRLIAEGTIEQDIVGLHREKRELVDALLAGAESAGKLSTRELAALIQGTAGSVVSGATS